MSLLVVLDKGKRPRVSCLSVDTAFDEALKQLEAGA